MYWLDEHMKEITNIFEKHEISFDFDGKMIKIKSPEIVALLSKEAQLIQ